MKIKLFDHPFAVSEPQIFEADNLAQWLLDHYGQSPSVKVQIFAGEPCAENEISRDIDAIMRGNYAEYVILQSPAGIDPISQGFFTYWVVSKLIPPAPPNYAMPGNINRTQQSPNNALGSRENKVRLMERVEDIYGTVKSIPSLMMPTYLKYINHRKYEYGYYCVGRGYHTIAELRDGDTLLADITGSSAAVYNPFTSPNGGSPVLQIGDVITDNILTASRAIEVDGVTLKALNQVQLPASAVYTFTPNAGGGIITQAAKTPNFNLVTAIDDTISVSMSGVVITTDSVASSVTVNAAAKSFSDDTAQGLFADIFVGDIIYTVGFVNGTNNAAFLVATKPNANLITTTSTIMVDENILTSVTFSVARNYSGNYTVLNVNDGSIQLDVASSAFWKSILTSVTCSVQIDGATEYAAWVTLPSTTRSEVWCNITAPNGMFKDASGNKTLTTVNFSIEIEKLSSSLVPLGIVETVTGSLSGLVSDERAITIEHTTAWTGPARVRMRRTTAYDYAFAGTVQDEIKWGDLYSVSPVVKTEFGNKTTIHTITQATSRATSVKSRQLNCIASRLLPTYNGTAFSGTFDANGLLASGTIAATSKLVNILAAVSVDPKIGARNIAEVDMAQIYAVQQLLDAWNTECGQFNYTMDSDNISFEETITTIANAGFCTAYRQNGKIRLAFDRAQTSSTALFTHRNKKPNAESITRKFYSDADYDGVEFIYVDPDASKSETITLPLSGSYTKLKKFEIAGIRSFAQAWLRANREYQKLLGQRINIETTTTLDARSLLPNSRVDIVDNTRFKSYDGEVIGQNGLELTLSQDVTFSAGLPHSIVLMKRDGSLQSIPVVAGIEPNKIILQSSPSEAVVTSYGVAGIRTIYSFAADSARGAMAYLVQEIDISDGQYVTLKGINYSANYYQADTAAIPDKASVIN